MPERVRRLLPAAATLLAAGAIAAIAFGVQGEARYARMLLAIVLGLGILNLVVVVASGALAARVGGVAPVLRTVPVMLLVGAAGALLSRLAGIEPPLLVGALLATAAGTLTGAQLGRSRAVVALVELAGMLGLGVLAWIGHGLVGPGAGFWGAGLSETLAAMAIAGLGSVVVLLLPIGGLPGRAVFDWSRWTWLGLAVVAVAVATVALAQGAFPVLLAVLGALGVAAVCVGVWAWVRFVEPGLASR